MFETIHAQVTNRSATSRRRQVMTHSETWQINLQPDTNLQAENTIHSRV